MLKIKDDIAENDLIKVGFIGKEHKTLFYDLINFDNERQQLFFRIDLDETSASCYTLELVYNHAPSDKYIGEINIPLDKLKQILDLVEEVSNE